MLASGQSARVRERISHTKLFQPSLSVNLLQSRPLFFFPSHTKNKSFQTALIGTNITQAIWIRLRWRREKCEEVNFKTNLIVLTFTKGLQEFMIPCRGPLGLLGTKPSCVPHFFDHREQPSLSLHDLSWIPMGRFKQLIREGRECEKRVKQSRTAFIFELFCKCWDPLQVGDVND